MNLSSVYAVLDYLNFILTVYCIFFAKCLLLCTRLLSFCQSFPSWKFCWFYDRVQTLNTKFAVVKSFVWSNFQCSGSRKRSFGPCNHFALISDGFKPVVPWSAGLNFPGICFYSSALDCSIILLTFSYENSVVCLTLSILTLQYYPFRSELRNLLAFLRLQI